MTIDGATLEAKIGQLPEELRREFENFVEFLLEEYGCAEQEQQTIAGN
jgi:hypothetical protein